MNTDKIVKLASKLMIELIKTDLPNKEINRLNDIVDDIREEAINYSQCCKSDSELLKDKEAMTFNDWVKSVGYEEKSTGFWKDGKSQDYWTMKDRYNVYRNSL
jgi:hypothetical protein